MTRTLLVGTVILLLAGCATEARYEAKVRTWEGRDADALLRSWGEPNANEKAANGDHILLYSRLKHEPLSYEAAKRQPAAADAPEVYIKCATYFEVTPDNMIKHVEFRGDECKSRD